MTTEEKQLLLRDLCARLPYKTLINIDGNRYRMEEICHALIGIDTYKITVDGCNIEQVKPYLYPLSSMTDEQRKELEELGLGYYVTCQDIDDGYMWDEKVFQITPGTETDDWMKVYHFDYRGLIPMGLAIDATGLNIY